jgi:hypothetical protein
MQVINGFLSVSSSLEDEPLVITQTFELSRGQHNAEDSFQGCLISMHWAGAVSPLLPII